MKILLIDDEEEMRAAASFGLARIGKMDVVEAQSGSEGLRLAIEQHPDLILLDVVMPGLDGPATLRLLRSRHATAHTPVIFLTGRKGGPEFDRINDPDVIGVIAKPFDPRTLAGEARTLLSRHVHTELAQSA